MVNKRIELIKYLAECIALLADEDNKEVYTPRYIISRYLEELVHNEEAWEERYG